MYNVKGAALSYEPTRKYCFSSGWSILATFSSLLFFWFFFGSISESLQAGVFSKEGFDKPTVHYLPSNKPQTDKEKPESYTNKYFYINNG